jgi:hypothetical protein
MPRQIPKKGLPLSKSSIIKGTRPDLCKFAIQSPKAPTPGKIIFSALAITSLSAVMMGFPPTAAIALVTLCKLPIP